MKKPVLLISMLRLKVLIAVALVGFGFAGITSSGFAQLVYTWRSAEGPHGGDVWSVLNGPENTIYAATKGGGVFRLGSDSIWYSWNFGLTNPDVRGLTMNQQGTVFAATMGGGVYKLENNGMDWQQASDGIDFPWMTTIICTSEGHLFAATIEGGGIYRSTDDGYSWTKINNGLTTTHINALLIDTQGHLFAGGYPGIFRSTDNGDTWQQMNNGVQDPYVLSLAEYWDNMIYAGLDLGAGIYSSINQGETWQADNNGLGTPAGVNALIMRGSNELFAGTYGMGIFRKQSGNAWEPVNEGLSSQYIVSLELDQDDNLLAGSFQGGGVFRSFQYGQDMTWYRENRRLAATNVMAFASNGVEIFAATYGTGIHSCYLYSNDWSRLTGDSVGRFFTDLYRIEGDNPVYAMADNLDGKGGLYRSTDLGSSWTELLNGFTEFDVRGVVVNSEGDIFAATYGDGILRSTDDGVTWQRVNNGLDCDHFWCIEVTPSDVLFAGSAGCDKGVYKSTDNGENWTLVNNGLLTKDVKTLHYSSGLLMAGTHPVFGEGGGIYLSDNLGDSWTEINNGLESLTVNDITSTYDGRFFAATTDGVYEYFGSDYWVSITYVNNEPGNKHVNGIYYDGFYSLHAGTAGSGAWFAIIEGKAKNIKDDQIALYPNPATEVIAFDNPYASGRTGYSIFNRQGSCVKTGVCTSARNTITVMNLAPGMYVLRLVNGSSVQKAVFIKR